MVCASRALLGQLAILALLPALVSAAVATTTAAPIAERHPAAGVPPAWRRRATAGVRPSSHAPQRRQLPPFGRAMLAEFQFEEGYRNFNFGSFGAVPRTVWAAFEAYQRRMEAVPEVWMRAEYRDLVMVARTRIAEYVRADVADLVLIENASGGVNAVYRALRFQPGDVLISLSNDYPVTTNILAWLAELDGVRVVTVPIAVPVVNDEVTFLAPLRAALDAHPTAKLVAMSHIVSYPAIIQPAAALSALCRERNVSVLVDGAHVPGQLDLDVPAVGADYYIGNLHKWMYGPKGSAFLWVSPARQASTVPTVISSEFGGADFVARFAFTGARDYCPMVAALDALDFRVALGDSAIKVYNRDLAWWAATYLQALWNTTLLAPREYVAAIVDVGLPVPLERMLDLYFHLYDAYGMITFMTEQNGKPYIRLSAQIFLEQQDFVELGAAVLDWATQRE